MHTYIHTYIHTHTDMHTYTYMHTYIPQKCTQKTAGASSLVFKYISVYACMYVYNAKTCELRASFTMKGDGQRRLHTLPTLAIGFNGKGLETKQHLTPKPPELTTPTRHPKPQHSKGPT